MARHLVPASPPLLEDPAPEPPGSVRTATGLSVALEGEAHQAADPVEEVAQIADLAEEVVQIADLVEEVVQIADLAVVVALEVKI